MRTVSCNWQVGGREHKLELAYVEGTRGRPYQFGEGADTRQVEVRSFYIGNMPVTQALWTHVMGPDSNPAVHRADELPLENVSWDEIHRPGGFLDQINESSVRSEVTAQVSGSEGRFRLPSESEWEYAARGGPRWRDGFRFSGSNDIDAVAWYDRRHGDFTQPVATKAPNQLGIYDMSGNVWEWCQDVFTPVVARIPTDGTPFAGQRGERVLRGGCFHNWAIHCTVSKRYQIAQECHDGCIGFRLVMADQ